MRTTDDPKDAQVAFRIQPEILKALKADLRARKKTEPKITISHIVREILAKHYGL